MEIKFTLHAKLKIKERNIDEKEIFKTIRQPEEIFLDVDTGNIVIIGERESKSGHKLIVVMSYDMKKVITIIDTSKIDIINIKKGEIKMDKDKVNIRYDSEGDILYILSRKGSIKDTIEIADDVFLEIGENDEILGIEIWQIRKNIFPEILKYFEELKKIVVAEKV